MTVCFYILYYYLIIMEVGRFFVRTNLTNRSLASPAPFPNHFLRKREKGLVPNATFSYPAVHRKLGPLRIINCFDLQPQIGQADWSNARVQNKMAARRIFRSIVPFIMPLKAIKETTVKQCDSLHL